MGFALVSLKDFGNLTRGNAGSQKQCGLPKLIGEKIVTQSESAKVSRKTWANLERGGRSPAELCGGESRRGPPKVSPEFFPNPKHLSEASQSFRIRNKVESFRLFRYNTPRMKNERSMKEIYLLRHGIAAPPGSPHYDDRDRPLTPEGKAQIREVARALLGMGIPFDLILSSPYLRARQTAEIVHETLDPGFPLKFSQHLVPHGSAKLLTGEINRAYGSKDRILLVGHEPFLSSLILTWVAGSAHGLIEMKKGGLAKLSSLKLKCGACASLEWLMGPRQILKT